MAVGMRMSVGSAGRNNMGGCQPVTYHAHVQAESCRVLLLLQRTWASRAACCRLFVLVRSGISVYKYVQWPVLPIDMVQTWFPMKQRSGLQTEPSIGGGQLLGLIAPVWL